MTRCPGDPLGHHWHLKDEYPLTKRNERGPWNLSRILWHIAALLFPIVGWTVLVCYYVDPGYTRIGVRRRWYCELCRAFETTEHLDADDR
jgi:hypothetical protein